LGQVALEMENFTQAQTLFEESASIYREIGDQRRLAKTLENIELASETLRH